MKPEDNRPSTQQLKTPPGSASPETTDFEQRHRGETEKRPSPARSGDMDRPGMDNDADVE